MMKKAKAIKSVNINAMNELLCKFSISFNVGEVENYFNGKAVTIPKGEKLPQFLEDVVSQLKVVDKIKGELTGWVIKYLPPAIKGDSGFIPSFEEIEPCMVGVANRYVISTTDEVMNCIFLKMEQELQYSFKALQVVKIPVGIANTLKLRFNNLRSEKLNCPPRGHRATTVMKNPTRRHLLIFDQYVQEKALIKETGRVLSKMSGGNMDGVTDTLINVLEKSKKETEEKLSTGKKEEPSPAEEKRVITDPIELEVENEVKRNIEEFENVKEDTEDGEDEDLLNIIKNFK